MLPYSYILSQRGGKNKIVHSLFLIHKEINNKNMIEEKQ